MKYPRRIVDLHTHLFNARYMPLASVITDVMRKDQSDLAERVAALLLEITDSSYEEQNTLLSDLHALGDDATEASLDELRIDKIWQITKHELLRSSGSSKALIRGDGFLSNLIFSAPEFNLLQKSNILTVVENLSNIDYSAEGILAEHAEQAMNSDQLREFNLNLPFGKVVDDFEASVKKSLRSVVSLMDSTAWGESQNYLEFFLTMIKSEEDVFAKLIEGYGTGLPPLQFVHYMMDLKMAYPGHRDPEYPFFPDQVLKMQKLQKTHPAHVFGFCAFDPRRPGDWRARAKDAIGRGFIGFKFYPPLGYKPADDDPTVQAVTNAFFDFCVDTDTPVFAHCTPQGFQTNKREGRNAHPRHWRTVLEQPQWSNLRLCLGHAGGARVLNGEIFSPGWMATSDAEWKAENNFARIVTELCTTYPNVHCEVANMLPLLSSDNGLTFATNLERARTAASLAGRPYDLMDKISYGTDWSMPDMVDNTRRYFDKFLEIMNRPEYLGYLDKFFWRNALKYMKVPE